MRNIVTKCLAAALVAGTFAIVASAQSNSKIVQFAKGKTSAVEKFTLNGDDGIVYILKVKKDDVMSASVGGSYTDGVDAQGLEIKLSKMGSDRALLTVSPGEQMDYHFKTAGDYEVTIMNAGNRRARITFNVEITNESISEEPAQESHSVKVKFESGETSAMVTKDIPTEGFVDFTIGARKGQTLSYTVGYDYKDSDVAAFLTEPGAQEMSKRSGPKAPQEFIVKKTGDHRLAVHNLSRKKITITLYVDIN